MTNIIEKIKKLKKMPRTNYFFMRRRIEKCDGRKTLGWILQEENSPELYQDKNFIDLYKKKMLLEEEEK